MLTRTAARLGLATALLGFAGWQAAPAAAAETVSVTSDIRVGDSGTLGGTVTFTRTLQADGTEVLVAQAHLLRTSVESSLCLSHHAFTRFQPWDNCPHKTEQTTDVSYTVNLGTEYVGSVLHIQFRVRMPEFPNKPGLANGYAGWHAPRHERGQNLDQYGEVPIPPPGVTPSPTPSSTGSPSPTPSSTGSPSPTPSSTGSPSPTPSSTGSPSPSVSASPGGSGSPSPSPTASGPLVPTGVNAGSGGGAAPGWPVFPSVLVLAGLGLAAESGRRLARGR
jgi:hypothetical protein